MADHIKVRREEGRAPEVSPLAKLDELKMRDPKAVEEARRIWNVERRTAKDFERVVECLGADVEKLEYARKVYGALLVLEELEKALGRLPPETVEEARLERKANRTADEYGGFLEGMEPAARREAEKILEAMRLLEALEGRPEKLPAPEIRLEAKGVEMRGVVVEESFIEEIRKTCGLGKDDMEVVLEMLKKNEGPPIARSGGGQVIPDLTEKMQLAHTLLNILVEEKSAEKMEKMMRSRAIEQASFRLFDLQMQQMLMKKVPELERNMWARRELERMWGEGLKGPPVEKLDDEIKRGWFDLDKREYHRTLCLISPGPDVVPTQHLGKIDLKKGKKAGEEGEEKKE